MNLKANEVWSRSSQEWVIGDFASCNHHALWLVPMPTNHDHTIHIRNMPRYFFCQATLGLTFSVCLSFLNFTSSVLQSFTSLLPYLLA
jgi:hypothetical protein